MRVVARLALIPLAEEEHKLLEALPLASESYVYLGLVP